MLKDSKKLILAAAMTNFPSELSHILDIIEKLV
jgi:hypothetical protein